MTPDRLKLDPHALYGLHNRAVRARANWLHAKAYEDVEKEATMHRRFDRACREVVAYIRARTGAPLVVTYYCLRHEAWIIHGPDHYEVQPCEVIE